MLTLVAIALLLLTPVIMFLVRLARPGFAYYWLIAATGVLLAWPLTMLAGLNLPQTIPLITWQPQSLFSGSPHLLVDHLSWPFAIGVSTLVSAVILTAVARMQQINWRAWAGSLILGGLGLIAVLAGNPLTLLLAWAALDLAELLILLLQVLSSSGRERIVIAFSARAVGLFLLVWANILGRTSGVSLTFDAIPPNVILLLLFAAALRLGVLPLHVPFLQELPLRRGLGTMLRLIPAAASLVLLTRTAAAGVPGAFVPYLLALVGLSALYSAYSWASAPDELSGRPFWVLGLASLSVAAALRSLPTASLAWGIALLLSGGLLFLYSARHKYLLAVGILGLLGFSGLPFTPAWEGMRLYQPPFTPLLIAFLLAQALLAVGYIRHMLQVSESLMGVERWVWAIYPLGLLLLPITHFLVGLRMRMAEEGMGLTGWLAGLLVTGLIGLILYLNRRVPRLPDPLRPVLHTLLSLNWVYTLFWAVYRFLGRMVAVTTNLLEGEGGVLWALVLLAILFSILAQNGAGV